MRTPSSLQFRRWSRRVYLVKRVCEHIHRFRSALCFLSTLFSLSDTEAESYHSNVVLYHQKQNKTKTNSERMQHITFRPFSGSKPRPPTERVNHASPVRSNRCFFLTKALVTPAETCSCVRHKTRDGLLSHAAFLRTYYAFSRNVDAKARRRNHALAVPERPSTRPVTLWGGVDTVPAELTGELINILLRVRGGKGRQCPHDQKLATFLRKTQRKQSTFKAGHHHRAEQNSTYITAAPGITFFPGDSLSLRTPFFFFFWRGDRDGRQAGNKSVVELTESAYETRCRDNKHEWQQTRGKATGLIPSRAHTSHTAPYWTRAKQHASSSRRRFTLQYSSNITRSYHHASGLVALFTKTCSPTYLQQY